ncbi:hypothetical protein DES38_103119 [Streptohalobacillus salinus]|uniref:Uncharacterized protein n=1 Tax=Streptohalobacillus salinus TaxID=621096 RepID=A0A2V3WDI5_9BACI|nr:NusG domain II-containing protein [Streptohalobacillus salinus]PXW92104.1 hypothetical protein DES38_103119 [Streptohalobacillus salinus]
MSTLFKQVLTHFKFGDVVILLLLVGLSFAPLLYFNATTTVEADEDLVAYVSIDGEVVDSFVLSEDTPHQEVTYYPNEGQYNIIEVSGTKIRVKEDNSPDQVAVKTSWISRAGQTSICLPHRLIIEIKGAHTEQTEDVFAY